MLVCSSLAAFAAKAVKEIDIRKQSEAGKYYVVFNGNKASLTTPTPGHMFVAWSKDDPSSCEEAYGMNHQFDEPLLSYLKGPVAGELLKESLDSCSNADYVLIVRVSADQYKKSQKVRDEWWKNGPLGEKYELLVTDCVAFSSHIAKSLGLKVPERDKNMLPSSFIQKMIELND